MRIIVGIDVGLKGALGVLDADSGKLLDVWDMPVNVVSVNGKDRGRISDAALLGILASCRGAHAFIEEPEARPLFGKDKRTGERTTRQPGAAGMLSLGASYGIARCACIAQGLRLTAIRPKQWKRDVGVTGNKDDSLRRAIELFPTESHYFSRQKDEGRAEAVLMAVWGANFGVA